MEEIHSQALSLAPGFQLKRVWRDYTSKGVKILKRKHTGTADLSVWELMDSGQTDGEPA